MPDDNIDNVKASPKERKIFRECLFEAFWFRAMPLALASGATVFQLIKRGKMKPNKKFGAWPKVVGVSFLGFGIGGLSYFRQDSCGDKFLKGAPDGKISYHIRKNRGLPQPWGAAQQFEDDDEVEIVEDKAEEAVKRATHTPTSTTIEVNVVLTEKEKEIFQECNDRAFSYYSLPTALGAGLSAYHGQRKGWLRKSKLKPPLQYAPKVIVAMSVGYIIGQVIYWNSTDCSDRMIEEAPDGVFAREFNKIKEGGAEIIFESNGERIDFDEPKPEIELNMDEYILNKPHFKKENFGSEIAKFPTNSD